jgi:hypothetical protein
VSPAVSNLIILSIITIILIQIKKIWKDYNYKFGFEWLLRKRTEEFLKLYRILVMKNIGWTAEGEH